MQHFVAELIILWVFCCARHTCVPSPQVSGFPWDAAGGPSVKMCIEGWNVGEERIESALYELEAALGHSFSRPELLVCALTHRSLAHELAQADVNIQAGGDVKAAGGTPAAGREDNERLEYLGDAV